MAERDVRERDILVAPNEYAYVQDLTKGDIVLYVGPTKISLSNTERMIVFRNGRFAPVRGEEAGLGVHKFVEASSSQYIVLENPPEDSDAQPVKGANYAVSLDYGRKIVVPGPARFPLWPGQLAQVVGGHELLQDEYLIARAYDTVDGEDSPIGSERIIRGNDVSFYIPKSGLEVVPDRGKYVRKALWLERNKGLHLRVVTAYESDGKDLIPSGKYEAGQEIFVRGREGFYFPINNLESLRLVEPIPLAEKEAVYVRRFDSGAISTVEGPINYLPDPTKEEVVQRVLGSSVIDLYNVDPTQLHRAVAVYVPPSTAVMVTGKTNREVVIGPQTRILNYNEELERLDLSTGRPKSDDNLLPTCFLQIEGNKVSDLVSVKTSDHVELEVLLSYRVSFVGDSHRWFSVKNYVGLLCDHLGSIIRAATRTASIERFHSVSTELLRSAILGSRNEEGKRDGRLFEENGMWVYDVEVLDVQILDNDVKQMLIGAQRTAIVSEIVRKEEGLRLGDEQLKESVSRQIYTAQIETLIKAAELEGANRTMLMAQVGTEMELDRVRTVSTANHEAEALEVESRARLGAAERQAEIERRVLEAQAEAFRHQMESLQPELIATLKLLGNKQFAGELTKNLAPLAILGGDSVADVAGRLLERLPLGSNGEIAGVIGGLLAGKSVVGADED